MAPEFLPFIVCGFLIMLSVVVCAALAIVWFAAPKWRRGTLLAFAPTMGLVVITGVCARSVHQAFFLNEPMAIAAARGEIAEVRALLDRGASPNSWGVDYISPAVVDAAAGGHADVVALLLARGADPNLRDSEQRSALQRARAAGHNDVATLLVRGGAREGPEP